MLKLIAAKALVNKARSDGHSPLHGASYTGHLDIVKFLIANSGNFLYKNKKGETPIDIAKTNKIKKLMINHPWNRIRPLLLTSPHPDHKTNKQHQLKPLGLIITARSTSTSTSKLT